MNTRWCWGLAMVLGFSLSATAQENSDGAGKRPVLSLEQYQNGEVDATKAVQEALDAKADHGGVVLLPEGRYRFNGTLSVPEGVTLEGTWQGPHTSHLDKGTVLLAYAGRDDASAAPFVSLHTSSAIKGVTVFYPEQTPDDIHPYPWTIQGRGQHFNVLDCTLVNAYDGVDCGSYHNEGHHLRNVHMCALHRGLFIDQCTDVGRVENVHIHNVYWWRVSAPYTPTREQNAAMERYTLEHLEGFIIGRTDWEFMSDCFVIWAKIGFHFISGPGAHAGGPGNAVITQSGSDIGPLAVRVDATQAHAGVAFENCQFMSGFEVGADNQGPVKLTNCGFWGASESGSQMVLQGSGTVTLTATHFSNEWKQSKDEPRIKALAGSLLMQNCDCFPREQQSPDVYLGAGLQSAVIIGNRFQSPGERIKNEVSSQEQVQILGNVYK